MKELPLSIKEKIDRYQPVTVDGITLYPVPVSETRWLSVGRISLEFMQQTLPVDLLSVPLLDALYQLDLRELKEHGIAKGYIASALILLCLALRLGRGEEVERTASTARIAMQPNDPERIAAITFFRSGEAPISVSPKQFAKLRPIVAAQNGIELISDTANPEIIAAERLMVEKEMQGIDANLADKVIFVSQGSGVPEEEVYNWPILKFERHAAVLRRKLDYLAMMQAQMSGMVTFKDGNPVPSPYFAKKQSGLRSLQSANAISAQAEAAIQNNDKNLKQ